MSDPQIPEALAPVVSGVATLHNFYKQSQAIPSNRKFEARLSSKGPQFSASNGSYALSPGDYAAIYGLYSVLPPYVFGTSTIAVVGRSNIHCRTTDFRSTFYLPDNTPTIIVNGTDPGDLGGGEEAEAVLDTSWAGATGQTATVDLVVSKSTNATDGVDLSEIYIIDQNLAAVMSRTTLKPKPVCMSRMPSKQRRRGSLIP